MLLGLGIDVFAAVCILERFGTGNALACGSEFSSSSGDLLEFREA